MKFVMLFTFLSSLALTPALPTMLISALIACHRERNAAQILRFLSMAGGLAVGIMVAWSYAVIHDGWPFSPFETFYATVHSDIYGDRVENAAEGYAIFMLFLGSLGAILGGITGWLMSRYHRRPALTV